MGPRQVLSPTKIEPSQIRGARAMLGWTQDYLAARSGVPKRSIAGFELESSRLRPETLQRLVACLAKGGIEFRNADDDEAGIALRKSTRRASAVPVARPGSRRAKAGSVRVETADPIAGTRS
jgi:transcriptional regulator with XRE-family HTH domain